MTTKDPPGNNEHNASEEAMEERRRSTLKELETKWDRRLRAAFDHPDFGKRVDAIMDACGRAKNCRKAGSSF
jgi:hypothetical protein